MEQNTVKLEPKSKEEEEKERKEKEFKDQLKANLATAIGAAVKRDKLDLVAIKSQCVRLDEELLPHPATVLIKRCEDVEVHVKARAIKGAEIGARLFMEGCRNCTLVLNVPLLADTLEVWNCHNTILKLNAKVSTVQLDNNNTCLVEYARKADFGMIVWAGNRDLTIAFADSPADNLLTELQLRKSFDQIDEKMDQFFIRIVDGKILKERMVRLPGGMPSTKREINDWNKRQAENEKKIEEAVLKMLARPNSPKPPVKPIGKHPSASKLVPTESAEAARPITSPITITAKGTEPAAAAGHKDAPRIEAPKPVTGSPLRTPLLGEEHEEDTMFRPDVSFTGKYGDVTLREFNSAEVEGATMMVSFPSVSFTGIITCGFIVEQFNLPLIGVLSASSLPPRCVVEGGTAAHAIRIYGDKRIVIVQCEYKLPNADIIYHITDALIAYVKRHHLKLIVSVEGLPSETKPIEYEKKVQFITTHVKTSHLFKSLGHTAVKQGVIAGTTGHLLAEAPLQGVDVACVLVPAAANYPDARSAFVVVKSLEKAFPELGGLDTAKLETKAKQLEQTVQDLLSKDSRTDGPPMGMYQ